MGIMSENYNTIKVRHEGPVCTIQFHRPEANNTINDALVEECQKVLKTCETDTTTTIVVLEGLPEVFCFGADFQEIRDSMKKGTASQQNPEILYNLWMSLATGPFISIAHVKGKANAGGIGFVSACDLVLASDTAVFSLSELLFGLMPACVLPFLVRRIGYNKANYMTLMTKPISVEEALRWGLVDAYEAKSEALLNRHLLRVRHLSKQAIQRYKHFMHHLADLSNARDVAVKANLEVFTDSDNLSKIVRYVETGKFPWEE